MPHNICSIENIKPAAISANQAKQNGEAFPTHVLPNHKAIKKEALVSCSSWRTFSRVQLWSQQHIIQSGEDVGWIMDAADCLPYRTVQTTTLMAQTRSLDPSAPTLGERGSRQRYGIRFAGAASWFLLVQFLISSFHCIIVFPCLPLS